MPRAIAQILAKKYLVKSAGQTNGLIQLEFDGTIATITRLNLLGQATVAPLHTCARHVNIDFIITVLTQELLVQSRLGRCHLTQVDVRKKGNSVAARSHHMPCACCTWHVVSVFCVLHPNSVSDLGRKDTVRLRQTI